MKNLFKADLHAKSIYDVTPQMLSALGVKGLVLDVDNTLCKYSCLEAEKNTVEFIDMLSKSGFKAVILSNGNSKRLKDYSTALGLEFKSSSAKPLPGGFFWAKQKLGLSAAQIAVIGDQVFTDIVGGNLAGMVTILTEPFDFCEPRFVAFKRRFEKPFRR